MEGRFGVFDGVELVNEAEFADDVTADEYRRAVLEEDLPEHLRRSEYDPHQLEVREIPEDYDNFRRLLDGLRASRKEDKNMPRECDNDDCDYETGVENDKPYARWRHVPECEGPVDYAERIPENAPDGSFLAYLQGRGKC